jgi:uncharacterized membrane protein YphA (DoxX/SURF4 family)
MVRWLVEDKHALHGAAAARILTGSAVLGILVSNIRHRDVLFGAGSVWAEPDHVRRPDYWPTEIVAHLGSTAFLFYYLAVIVVALLWILGWHTRIAGLLVLIGEVSIIERAPLVGDQGDNILRIGLIFLVLMQTNEYWSMDARRRTRRGTGTPILPLWLSNAVHNIALVTLGSQLVVAYFSAGMAKARGDLWQHGTALYYPLQLQEFRPFPLLNDLFTHVGLVVGIATYVVVVFELGFGFALLHPVARRIAIGVAVLMHVSIAVLMALPWFSLSMLAVVAIFVSTSSYVALDSWVRERVRRSVGRDDLSHAPAGEHQDDDG